MKCKNFFLTFLVLLLMFCSTSLQAQLQEATQVPWPGFEVLLGRWGCPGRGIIYIKNISSTGSMQVQFFNPEPIHVTQAQAARDGTSTRVLIILRHADNLCCTYNLAYNPASDQLRGVFWQKDSPKTSEVVFSRMPSLPSANF